MPGNFYKIFAQSAVFSLTTVVAAAGQPIVITQSPPLASGVAAFPRVGIIPEQSQADRINRALQSADARVIASATECKNSGGDQSGWSRNVAVTMRGPRYLSFMATDDWFCGGAHPDTDQIALVYDLSTGAPVNWGELLPATLFQNAVTETLGDGTVLGLVSSTALKSIYVPAASQQSGDTDCNGVLTDARLNFMLWPDAQADGIGILPGPDDLPHVAAACATKVLIPMSELRRLGVAEVILDAIDEAHSKAWYGQP